MTPPNSHKPTTQDAFTPLPPPLGGRARLRAALDAEASSPHPPWAALRPHVLASAIAITTCVAGILWALLPSLSPRAHPSSTPLTVVLISEPPLANSPPTHQEPFALRIDPLWQASLPIPDSALRPHQAPHLLPIPLGDDAVAFYWAESPIPTSP